MIEDRDPFAYAGMQQNQDAEILTLFDSWLDACDEHDQLADDDEAAIDDNYRRRSAIEKAIVTAPGGPIGLAIKTFLNCRLEATRWTPKTAQLRFFGDASDDLFASLLRDAAMILPEIGELAAAVIHDDAVLIDAEMDIEWVMAVWPDGNHTDDWRRSALATGHKAIERIARTPAKTPRGEGIKVRYRNVTLCPMPDGSIGRRFQRASS